MCCSIEAYPIPTEFLKPELATEQPLPFLQHSMPGMMFTTSASFSRVRCTRSPSGDVYALFALAKDQCRGMYQYQARVHTAPVPSLSASFLGFDAADDDLGISVWDLGTSGLRGAWVRRPIRSSEHHVAVFTTSPSRFPSEAFPSA